MLDFEKNYWDKYDVIIGLDEVGRGCLAGELVVAGVIFPKGYSNSKIKDSKQLTEKQREELYEEIVNDCVEYVIEVRTLEQINNSNPKRESILGMESIVKKFKNKPDLIITDYEKLNLENYEQINLVKGDSISLSVAAASILAKVTRDRMLKEYSKIYPEYDFDNNKGYGTKKHLDALNVFGPTKIHRTKYKPVVASYEKHRKYR
ncbi:ribonuclease HII [Mycoplasma sp. 2045]|uniref:ribonuclease HII n=1 Tax=unclassified Mycoplasma TaxID=2683645 RepID=UPI00211CA8F7|nr:MULTISPECIES: ribonuclease HII [unclassified Mycoplasma]MEA4191217.1 ribonuclease HII [Mycoplasma sp. 2248]UUM20405.1 ribonuclease HII [Mycoplasma sp. 2045]